MATVTSDPPMVALVSDIVDSLMDMEEEGMVGQVKDMEEQVKGTEEQVKGTADTATDMDMSMVALAGSSEENFTDFL